MFSTLSKIELIILATWNLLSANAVNLVQPRVFLRGVKEKYKGEKKKHENRHLW